MTQRRPEGGQQAVLGLPGGSPGLAGDGSWVTWGWSGNDPEAAGRRSDVLQSRRPCREQGVPPLPRAPLHPASHPLSTGKPCEAAGARAWRGRAARMAQVPATPGARPAPGASPSPAPAEPPSGRRGPRGRAFVFVGVRSVPSRVLVSGVVARSCGCRFGWEGTERGLPAACPLARARAPLGGAVGSGESGCSPLLRVASGGPLCWCRVQRRGPGWCQADPGSDLTTAGHGTCPSPGAACRGSSWAPGRTH